MEDQRYIATQRGVPAQPPADRRQLWGGAQYRGRDPAAGDDRGTVLPVPVDDATLEVRLYPETPPITRIIPDWATVHQELTRKGVTLALLWQEYQAAHPGYQYSRFCDRYRRLARTWNGVCARSIGGREAVRRLCGPDHAGPDRHTGELREAGSSSRCWGAPTTPTPRRPGPKRCRMDGLACPGLRLLRWRAADRGPRQSRAGHRACRYEPELNPTYQTLAQHYGVAVIPARVRKPRDKAKVEVGVQIVERWILACLRHQPFFSLVDLNAAIATCLSG